MNSIVNAKCTPLSLVLYSFECHTPAFLIGVNNPKKVRERVCSGKWDAYYHHALQKRHES